MAETGIRAERGSWMAPALLVAGVAALGYTLRSHWNPQEMNPGVEGALTTGVFAPLLLLLEGLRFSDMLKAAVPIWIIQFAACAAVSGPALAALGIELCVIGAVGLVVNAAAARPRKLVPRRRGEWTRADQPLVSPSCDRLSPVHHVGASAALSSSSSSLSSSS